MTENALMAVIRSARKHVGNIIYGQRVSHIILQECKGVSWTHNCDKQNEDAME